MKIIPIIYLKDGVAYKDLACNNAFDKDAVALCVEYSFGGADEIMIYDISYDDASHDKAIGIMRDIANSIDVPMLVGGTVWRMEDVKKYIYAGAKACFLLSSNEKNMAIMKEAKDRFGKEKILCFYDKADEDALALAEDNCYGVVSFDKLETNLSCITPIEDCTFDIMAMKQELKAKGIDVNTFESKIPFSEFKLNEAGLIPVIVTDYKTDEVLMMAYMNEESFNKTIETGRMTYFSRSRQSLWVKGETSGHFQYLMSLEIDCDNDTLLAKVKQIGAACHTGNRSCFYRNLCEKEFANTNPLKVFNSVMETILDRKAHPKEGSYTNYLFDKGIDKILKKVGEECTEIVIAAKNPDKEEIKYEVADFLYHVMVLMAYRGVTWDEIITELARR